MAERVGMVLNLEPSLYLHAMLRHASYTDLCPTVMFFGIPIWRLFRHWMQHLLKGLRESRQQRLYLPEVCSFPLNMWEEFLQKVVVKKNCILFCMTVARHKRSGEK